MAVHPPEAINWGRVLNDEDSPELTGSPREQGRQFHHWLQRQFDSYQGIGFERELEWRTDTGWTYGRFDCFDGHYVYEFKTVSELPETPREADVEQLQGYLKGVGVPHGVVVYVYRDELGVRQFLVEC